MVKSPSRKAARRFGKLASYTQVSSMNDHLPRDMEASQTLTSKQSSSARRDISDDDDLVAHNMSESMYSSILAQLSLPPKTMVDWKISESFWKDVGYDPKYHACAVLFEHVATITKVLQESESLGKDAILSRDEAATVLALLTRFFEYAGQTKTVHTEIAKAKEAADRQYERARRLFTVSTIRPLTRSDPSVVKLLSEQVKEMEVLRLAKEAIETKLGDMRLSRHCQDNDKELMSGVAIDWFLQDFKQLFANHKVAGFTTLHQVFVFLEKSYENGNAMTRNGKALLKVVEKMQAADEKLEAENIRWAKEIQSREAAEKKHKKKNELTICNLREDILKERERAERLMKTHQTELEKVMGEKDAKERELRETKLRVGAVEERWSRIVQRLHDKVAALERSSRESSTSS